jgi:hypothetical protein
MCCSGICLAFGSLCACDTSQDLLLLLLVQWKRLDHGYDLVFSDRVSLLQLHAQHPTWDWGGDDESIMRPGFAILIHGHAHGTASRFRDLHEDRSRAQHDPNQRGNSQRKCR